MSTDLAAMNGALRGAGANVTYEPATLVYKLFEQD